MFIENSLSSRSSKSHRSSSRANIWFLLNAAFVYRKARNAYVYPYVYENVCKKR